MAGSTDVAPITSASNSSSKEAVTTTVEIHEDSHEIKKMSNKSETTSELVSTASPSVECEGTLSGNSSTKNEGDITPEEMQMLEKLCCQLEYYFSPDNLCKDAFLQSVMSQFNGYVPVKMIAGFSNVKKILKTNKTQVNIQWVTKAATLSSMLDVVLLRDMTASKRSGNGQLLGIGPLIQVDLSDISLQYVRNTSEHSTKSTAESGEMKRSKSWDESTSSIGDERASSSSSANGCVSTDSVATSESENKERSLVILRDMPPETKEEDVSGLVKEACTGNAFDGEPIKTIHQDVGNCWFVQLNTEDKGIIADCILKLRLQKFKGEPIKARLKIERGDGNRSKSDLVVPPSERFEGRKTPATAGSKPHKSRGRKQNSADWSPGNSPGGRAARNENITSLPASPSGKSGEKHRSSPKQRGNQNRQRPSTGSPGKNKNGKEKSAERSTQATELKSFPPPPPLVDASHYPELLVKAAEASSLKKEKAEANFSEPVLHVEQNSTGSVRKVKGDKETLKITPSATHLGGYAAALLKKNQGIKSDTKKEKKRGSGAVALCDKSLQKQDHADSGLDSNRSTSSVKSSTDSSVVTNPNAAPTHENRLQQGMWKALGSGGNTSSLEDSSTADTRSTGSATSSSIGVCKINEVSEPSTISVSTTASTGNCSGANVAQWGAKRSFADILKTKPQSAVSH